jgi:hypothetical protein
MYGSFEPPKPPPPAVTTTFYTPEPDALLATAVLVNSGYRPFTLQRRDNGLTQTVWVKNEGDVGRYAEGATLPQVMGKSTLYSQQDAIVVDLLDGGFVVRNGHIIK